MISRKVLRRRETHRGHRLSAAGFSSLGAHLGVDVGILARVQAKDGVVHVPHDPKVEEEEEWTSDYIEDTVPYHLGRGGDDVRTLRTRPTDGVGNEHEREVGGGHEVALLAGALLGEGPAGRVPEQDVPDRESAVSNGA